MHFPQDPQLQQALDIAALEDRYSSTAAVPEGNATTVLAPPICCIECLQPWVRDAERWRLKLLDEPGKQPELVPYCPACHRREFE
jgi:hypothetical protein